MENKYDVFISCKSEDYEDAWKIHDFLVNNGLRVFFADAELKEKADANYSKVINKALDATKHMLVYASSVEHLESKWVEHEYSTFAEDLRNGWREGNLVTVLSNISRKDLPADLRKQESCTLDNLEHLLPYLIKDTQISNNAHIPEENQETRPHLILNQQGKWGYADINDNVIIPCEYDFANIFSEGLAAVRRGDKWGFIDEKNAVVIPFVFDEIYPFTTGFCEGFCRVVLGYKEGLIDKRGRIIIPFEYDTVGNCINGIVDVQKDGKWGAIDNTGKTVIPCVYKHLQRFEENGERTGVYAGVKDNKCFLINLHEDTVLPLEYDEVSFITDGLAPVRRHLKYGFINKYGWEVVPPKYAYVREFSEGLANVKQWDDGGWKYGKYGFVDKQGHEVIPCQFDNAGSFSGGLADVSLNNKYGFINKKGEIVIPLIYDEVSIFEDGDLLRLVKKDGKWGYIDKEGNEVIKIQYDEAYSFFEGLAQVKKGGKWGFINESGEVVIPFIYDVADCMFCRGFNRVERSGKEIWIDKKGHEYPFLREFYNILYD